MRALYSFPNKIGAERICNTAWHQVTGAAQANVKMMVMAGSVARNLPPIVNLRTTLSYSKIRIPYSLIGRRRACNWHDWLTARWLERHHAEIDLVHGWPLSSLRTIKVAKRLHIPVVLERPNTHTAFAYRVADEENRLIGVDLPPGHDHQFDQDSLALEEAEYQTADFLLCPSDFVAKTFMDLGFPPSKLLRHRYGFDENRFTPGLQNLQANLGLIAIYAGVCEPRKGLHYALEAWVRSGACNRGRLLVCGEFVPGYAERLAPWLAHPSVEVLGLRSDLPELMKKSDVFVLSSVEEGSALVTYEARAAGCILAVSDATGAVCQHQVDGLIHPARSVEVLTDHLRLLDQNRYIAAALREASLASTNTLTWTQAGEQLANTYKLALDRSID